MRAATTGGLGSPPALDPVAGVSLEQFAAVVREATDRGVADGDAARAAGIDEVAWREAAAAWRDRIRVDPRLGSAFHRAYEDV